MSVTTTATFSWTTASTAGVTGYLVSYRLLTDTIVTQISTGTTSVSIPGLQVNRIYWFTVETLTATTNWLSSPSQAINITDPNPLFSPVANSISFSFNNLSVDMDSYVTTIALASNPSAILQTHQLTPSGFPAIVTDSFTGLNALTNYIITVTPAANQFFKQFTYNVTTQVVNQCPAPLNVLATLT